MLAVSELLTLWSALAAAARKPGRLQVLRAAGGEIPGQWRHPVPTVVVGLLGVVRIERPSGPPIDLQAGDAVVIAPGTAHRHVPLRRDSAALELGFDYGWCDLEFHGAATSLAATLPRQPAEAQVQGMLAGETQALGRLLDLLLARPLQDMRHLPAAALAMRDRIRSHGLTPISAADVARAGGLQPSRAWQVFKVHFGCTPRQALERRRCAVAAAQLEAGMGVAEVAQACGFRDRGTFSRAFVRVHGVAPRSRKAAAGL